MKRNILIIIAGLVLAASASVQADEVTTTTSSSPVVPVSLPTTAAAMRSEGLKRMGYVGGNLYANSILYDNNTRNYFWFPWNGAPDPDAVFNAIRSNWFNFRSSDPEHDQYWYYIYVFDKNGQDQLFRGENSFRLEKNGAVWQVPYEAVTADFEQLPLQYVFPNAYAASIITEDGRVISLAVDQDTGKITLPLELDGYRGQVLVYTYNPTTGQIDTYAYSIGSGAMVAAITLFGYFDAHGFKDVVVLNPSFPNLEIYSQNGVGTSPLAVMKVTAAGYYFIRAKTSEGELPVRAMVERTDDSSVRIFGNGSYGMQVFGDFFLPGLYHIRFEWMTLHEAEPVKAEY